MAIDRPRLLFVVLAGFFLTNAVLAEFIGSKIFSLERSLGFEPLNLSLPGTSGLSFDMTAGVLLWPIVFITTDIINEYFGRRGVQLLSFLAVGLIIYSFFVAWLAIRLQPAEFWRHAEIDGQKLDMQPVFAKIYGQSLWIQAGSVTAFLLGQLLDVWVFRKLRAHTGEGRIWLRATLSTLASQWLDTFVVLFIAFYLGGSWSLSLVLSVGLVNYLYKFVVAWLMLPLLYGMHHFVSFFLGKDAARAMAQTAFVAQ